jgi:hypothetical protein
MLQDQPADVGWDLMQMHRSPPGSAKLYVLFLFVVWVVAIIKLIGTWRQAWQFRLSRQANNPAYFRLLRASSDSLRRWILCTFLAWGILTSISLYDSCTDLSFQGSIRGQLVLHLILYAIQGYAGIVEVTFVTVMFLFLIRWHMLNRIERLGDYQNPA